MTKLVVVKSLPLLLLLTAQPLVAQRRSPPSPPPVSLTETAALLARNGAANQNARTVMAAAEILRAVERGTPRVQRIGPVDGPTGPWDGPMTSAALLQLASAIATDHNDWGTAEYVAWLRQLPDSVPPTRGASGGPVWADAYLGVGREATYTVEFEGGITPNVLQVSAGKASSVLQCDLYEEGNSRHPTVRLGSLAGTCSIEWRQATQGKMTLRIRNAGPATYFVVSSN
jgi:hypothetical protein